MSEENNIPKKRPSKNGVVKQLFNYDWILKNMTFFLFLALLAVVYIANGHMADNRIRKINSTAKELKELQYEYKTVKSDMMFRSRESEMIKAAEPLGLTMDTVPPKRILLISKRQKRDR